jgi:hypothetical protein
METQNSKRENGKIKNRKLKIQNKNYLASK